MNIFCLMPVEIRPFQSEKFAASFHTQQGSWSSENSYTSSLAHGLFSLLFLQSHLFWLLRSRGAKVATIPDSATHPSTTRKRGSTVCRSHPDALVPLPASPVASPFALRLFLSAPPSPHVSWSRITGGCARRQSQRRDASTTQIPRAHNSHTLHSTSYQTLAAWQLMQMRAAHRAPHAVSPRCASTRPSFARLLTGPRAAHAASERTACSEDRPTRCRPSRSRRHSTRIRSLRRTPAAAPTTARQPLRALQLQPLKLRAMASARSTEHHRRPAKTLSRSDRRRFTSSSSLREVRG